MDVIVEKVIHNMTRPDFREFREMAIDGLLEATFYEYLYLGCPVEQAEALKASLRRALARWWDAQHVRVPPIPMHSPCTQGSRDARKKPSTMHRILANQSSHESGR
jgi:hypothetical protein